MNFLNKKHIGLIRFNGSITRAAEEKFRPSFLNLEKNAKNLEAVAFVVNSRGGSAVTSNAIASNIKTLCKNHNLKLYTFAEDYAVSGGYWLICIGDEVYSYKSSKVGSIGVLFTSMDFKNFLEKLNIERIGISSKSKEDEE